MSNTIVIELCAEDRARLDRLAEAMERRACDKCIASAMEAFQAVQELDPVQKAAAETLTKVNQPKEATTSQTTELQEEATVVNETPSEPTPTKTVSHAELMAKVIELSAKDLKLKAQAREIILAYAPRVKAVPEDKIAECYNKLVALEG